MIIATLLAKLAGMYREVLFASLFGTGSEAQAFLTASRIPLLFFDITLGAAVSAAFIPVFNGYIEEGRKEAATEYANTFITLIFLITGIMCAVGIVFSGTIVNMIGKDLTTETKTLASGLVIILFPTMIFTALAYAIAGLLQSLGEFNVPAAISLVSNGFMVVFLLVFKSSLGIRGVAVAMLIAWGLQLVVEIPPLMKKKYQFRPRLELKNEGIKKSARLALPILISSWVQPINTTVNIYLASSLSGGRAVAALDYANKLYIIFVGVLTYAVSNLIFPSLSRAAQNEDKTDFTKMLKGALRVVIALILPVMVIFLVLRVPIVGFVYERGEFDNHSTALTASALLFYSIGMLGFGIQEIANKAFYSLKDGKTPMYVAMAGIIINILLSFLLVRGIGAQIWGLALSASVAACLIAGALIFIINKKLRFIDIRFVTNFLKLLLSAALMGFVTYFVYSFLPPWQGALGRLMLVLLSGGAGTLLYTLLLVIFRTDEFTDVVNMIKSRKKD